MVLWKWKAFDDQGKTYRGVWDEGLSDTVVSKLRRQKLYPVKIQRSIRGSWGAKFRIKREKLYWARTCHKIGTYMEAGISLLTILEILAEKESNLWRKNQWQKVRQSVLAGNDLSTSLEKFSPRPGFFLESMIQAGEKSGTLAECVLDCAVQMEEDYFFEQKIKTVLFYPLLLLLVALLVIYILSIFVLPMYEDLFQGLEVELPLLTKALFRIGSSIPLLLGVVFIAGIISKVLPLKSKRKVIPGTGQIRHYRLLVQFCTLLGRLLRAGIPLLDSLTLLRKLTKGSELYPIVGQLQTAVQEGKRLSPVIMTQDFFPLETAKMLEAAEESGRLSEMLEQLSILFKKELEEKLQRFTRILEPVLILGMAGLVGFVAFGVLLPIFDLSMHIP